MSSKNFAQHNSVFLKYLCLQCPPLLLYEHLRLSFHSAKNSQIQQKFLGWGVGAFKHKYDSVYHRNFWSGNSSSQTHRALFLICSHPQNHTAPALSHLCGIFEGAYSLSRTCLQKNWNPNKKQNQKEKATQNTTKHNKNKLGLSCAKLKLATSCSWSCCWSCSWIWGWSWSSSLLVRWIVLGGWVVGQRWN